MQTSKGTFGPFSDDELRSLLGRGRIKSHHLVSADGSGWRRADEAGLLQGARSSAEPLFRIVRGGSRTRPHTAGELASFAAAGRIAPDDQVVQVVCVWGGGGAELPIGPASAQSWFPTLEDSCCGVSLSDEGEDGFGGAGVGMDQRDDDGAQYLLVDDGERAHATFVVVRGKEQYGPFGVDDLSAHAAAGNILSADAIFIDDGSGFRPLGRADAQPWFPGFRPEVGRAGGSALSPLTDALMDVAQDVISKGVSDFICLEEEEEEERAGVAASSRVHVLHPLPRSLPAPTMDSGPPIPGCEKCRDLQCAFRDDPRGTFEALGLVEDAFYGCSYFSCGFFQYRGCGTARAIVCFDWDDASTASEEWGHRRRFGRSWKWETGSDSSHYHAPDDLALMGEEYLVVKQRLIAQICKTAEAIAERNEW